MRSLFPLLMLVVTLASFTAANIYIVKRTEFYFGIENIRHLYILFASLTVYMIAGLIAFTNSQAKWSSLPYGAATVVMGYLLYLLVSIALVDLVRLATKLNPSTYGIMAYGLATLITLFSVINAFNIRVTQQVIPIKGLTREVRAMHLSDIHIGHFRGSKFLDRIVDKTIEQNVEAVFLTGDLFDGRIRLSDKSIEPLKRLAPPVFFIEGNHDGYTGTDTIKAMLRRAGIRVLENEVADWGKLQVIGLDHMLVDTGTFDMHAPNGNQTTIRSVLPTLETDPSKPLILLHHSPVGVELAAQKGVNLYLAGHTHAGQIFPISLFSKIMYPYNRGLYKYNGTRVFVSQGAGTFGPPMRLGTRSEITVLRLVPEDLKK